MTSYSYNWASSVVTLCSKEVDNSEGPDQAQHSTLNTQHCILLQSQIVLLFYHSHNELHHHGWLHGYSWSKMWRPSRPRNLNKYYAEMMMMMVMWWSGVSQQTPPVATFEPAVTSFSSKQWAVLELGWAGQQMMMMWCVGGGWVVAGPSPSHALYIYY